MSDNPTYEELKQKVKELEKRTYDEKRYDVERLKAEDIYQQLAENIQEVLIINSPDKTKTIYVNPAYEKMWGMTCSSLYENPKSFLDAIHPLDRKRVIETFSQQKDGKSVEVEYRLVQADGSVVWVNSRTWTSYNVLEYPKLSFVAIREITRRKQLEENLAQANEKLEERVANSIGEIKQYKHIVETMDNLIGMVDRNFIYRYANEPYSQALNKPIFEIIGHSVPELFGKTFFETTMEKPYKQCFSGEKAEYQEWFDLPGWGRRYLDVRYYPFQDSDGHVIAAIVNVHDITRIKKTAQYEHKLSEWSSEFINLSSENLDHRITDVLDWIGPFVQADRAHMFRFNWDRTEFRISHLWEVEGIKKDEIVYPGLMVKDSFPWLFEHLADGKDVIVPEVEELSAPETKNEYLYCQEMGIQSFVILPIEMEGAPLCAIGLDAIHRQQHWSNDLLDRLRMIGQVVANTIARRHAEIKSEEASLRYQTIADFTYDWEYWQGPDGAMQYVSPSCERISGYPAEAFVHNPGLLREIIVKDDQTIWDAHREKSKKEMKGEEIQFRINRADGETCWIEHACQPVFDNKGLMRGVRASNRDITKRKYYRAETDKLHAALAHMDRVVTISTLTSALAHEINQPLAAMRSYAQAALRFMDRDQPDYSSVRKALQGIVSDNKRAADVVNRLRALVKKGQEQRESININALIKDVIGLVNSELVLRDTVVSLGLDPNVAIVQGDPVQIQQVMINLLTNALDAMDHLPPDKRTMTVSTRNENSNRIIVSISDSGEGIVHENFQTIFSPFHTTKSTGMGLGLSICKTIIAAHGGSIHAENNPDGGALFSFSLSANDTE